jgi:hypothetical protein
MKTGTVIRAGTGTAIRTGTTTTVMVTGIVATSGAGTTKH